MPSNRFLLPQRFSFIGWTEIEICSLPGLLSCHEIVPGKGETDYTATLFAVIDQRCLKNKYILPRGVKLFYHLWCVISNSTQPVCSIKHWLFTHKCDRTPLFFIVSGILLTHALYHCSNSHIQPGEGRRWDGAAQKHSQSSFMLSFIFNFLLQGWGEVEPI